MTMDTAVMGVDTDAADAAAAAEAAFAASLTSDMLASSFAAGDDMLAMDQGWMVDDSQPPAASRPAGIDGGATSSHWREEAGTGHPVGTATRREDEGVTAAAAAALAVVGMARSLGPTADASHVPAATALSALPAASDGIEPRTRGQPLPPATVTGTVDYAALEDAANADVVADSDSDVGSSDDEPSVGQPHPTEVRGQPLVPTSVRFVFVLRVCVCVRVGAPLRADGVPCTCGYATRCSMHGLLVIG